MLSANQETSGSIWMKMASFKGCEREIDGKIYVFNEKRCSGSFRLPEKRKAVESSGLIFSAISANRHDI